MGGYIFAKTTAAALTRSRWASIPRRSGSRHLPEKFYAEKVFPAGILGDNGLNAIDSLFTEKKSGGGDQWAPGLPAI